VEPLQIRAEASHTSTFWHEEYRRNVNHLFFSSIILLVACPVYTYAGIDFSFRSINKAAYFAEKLSLLTLAAVFQHDPSRACFNLMQRKVSVSSNLASAASMLQGLLL
jgi:hypothetical protein